ncbi:MAG: nucleotidyltransferase substrate binding protein [Bdellovibrionales bacterium]|nr:nucleotidyltransferase substrate binding protein [Bdellovibrionales bacterium]
MNKKQKMQSRINVDHLSHCIKVLEDGYKYMQEHQPESVLYDIFRSACIKEFEVILEQCGKLLKKRLRVFFASNKAVDELTFKDIFRYAAKHGLISMESGERWLIYRDNRNSTAHDYGKNFAEQTLKLLPKFIIDAKEVLSLLRSSKVND